jgi:hypothetical protein
MSADINLDNINADLSFSGGLDLNLDDVRLALSGSVDFGVAAIAQVLRDGVKATVGIGLDNFGAAVDVGLDDVKAAVDVGLDDIRIRELPLIRSDSKLDLGLDNIRIQELPPINLELAIRPTRVHLPLNYSFTFEIFGIRLFRLSLCGEGMVVSEDYHAHDSERC